MTSCLGGGGAEPGGRGGASLLVVRDGFSWLLVWVFDFFATSIGDVGDCESESALPFCSDPVRSLGGACKPGAEVGGCCLCSWAVDGRSGVDLGRI